MSSSSEAPVAFLPPETPLSPLERAVRVFVRPSEAWSGLQTRAQWWIPLILILVLSCGLSALTYHRAMVPMILDQWDTAVANGQMQPEQVAKMSEFFEHNPVAPLLFVGQQLVAVTLIVLFVALVFWFGLGFVLGTKFRYRLALEVVCWASLVRLPETIATFIWAWFQETFKGIHFGLAALLPEVEHPSKLHLGLTVLLDSIGPFSAWFLVVAILGGAVLTGAPRKNVAWVVIVLYFALSIFSAALAAAFSPGA